MQLDNSFERAKQPNSSAIERVSRLNALRDRYIKAATSSLSQAIERNPALQILPEATEVIEPVIDANTVIPFRPTTPEARVYSEQQYNKPNQAVKAAAGSTSAANTTQDPAYLNMTVKPMSELERIQADVDRAFANGPTTIDDPTLAALRPGHYDRSGNTLINQQRAA